MRIVIQRVTEANVKVEGKICGKIGHGLLILVGIEESDSNDDIEWLCKKIVNMRIFDDENGIMNKSIIDIDGNILAISQFTLMAQTKKGNRPSFINSEEPEKANALYEYFCNELLKNGIKALKM